MSENTIPQHDTPSAIGIALAGLAALAVAMGIGRFAFTPVLPMMLHDSGLSIAAGGWLASANYLGYLLGALSATAIRVRAGIAVRVGLLAIAVVTLAMALPLPFAGWLLLRLLAGMASAWVLIAVSAWSLETLARYQRPLLGSVVFAGVGIGIALAGLLCIALGYRGAASWLAWLLLGLLSLVTTALVWRRFAPEPATAAGARQAAKGLHRNAQAWRLVLCYGVYGFGYIIPATFLPVMAKHALPGSALFGLAWPIFGLAAALSTLAAAWLGRHAGYRRLWMACHFVMAIGVALPAFRADLATILAAALCVGGTFMVITLAAMQEARRVAGSHAAVLIGAMTSAFALGQILGPLSVSLAAAGGFSGALLFAAAMLAASALLLI
jgi:MFS family permease